MTKITQHGFVADVYRLSLKKLIVIVYKKLTEWVLGRASGVECGISPDHNWSPAGLTHKQQLIPFLVLPLLNIPLQTISRSISWNHLQAEGGRGAFAYLNYMTEEKSNGLPAVFPCCGCTTELKEVSSFMFLFLKVARFKKMLISYF